MKALPVAVVALLATTGCAQPDHITPVRLPVPDPPILPTIQETEVGCLSQETWRKIVIRDAIRAGYAEQLRAILTAYNPKPTARPP